MSILPLVQELRNHGLGSPSLKKDPSPNWTAPGRNLPRLTEGGKKSLGNLTLNIDTKSIANGEHGHHGEAAPNRVELAHRVKEGKRGKEQREVAKVAQDLPLTLGAATPVHAQVIR